jgi:drug/metabolite transporter (DMT)-like permease
VVSKNSSHPSLLKVVLAFAAIYIIWGSTYAGILVAIESVPPFLMIGVRFIVAGIILYLFGKLKKYPAPTRSLVFKNSFAGILMLYFGTGAVTWVEQHISSGLTAILIASAPIWYIILDRRLWQFHFKNRNIIAGILIGIIGVIFLVNDNTTFNFSENKFPVISIFVLFVGNILWVIGSLFLKYRTKEGSPIMNAAVQMLAAGVGLLITAFVTGEHNQFELQNVTWRSVAALLYLITFGSLIAYSAYVWLLTVRPPSIVGTHALANPVVAVLVGWLLLNEKFNATQVVALFIILAGVLLVNFTKINAKETR